jgi:ABC-2 type transport system permease protein
MRILRVELFKIFNRRRSYIGFIAILVLLILLVITFYYEGTELFGFITQNLEATFILQGTIVNGNLLAYIALKSLWVHFPILIALVIGDLISGEEESGTLRLILTRPASRISLITAKFISGFIYVISLVVFMAIVSISMGYIVFGPGDLLVLMTKLNIFAQEDVMWRFAMAYLFGALSMCTVAALSIFMSAVMKNTLAAILGTIAILIVLNFASLFNIPIFSWAKPFLFTTYMSSWQSFFDYNTSMALIVKDATVLISYILIFYVATVYYFSRKDILS